MAKTVSGRFLHAYVFLELNIYFYTNDGVVSHQLTTLTENLLAQDLPFIISRVLMKYKSDGKNKKVLMKYKSDRKDKKCLF